MTTLTVDQDLLIGEPPVGSSERFFDRFYFNLHGPEPTPLIMIGAGSYPNRQVVDGYLIRVDGGRQRNVRFSNESGRLPATGVGPLSWEIVEPLRAWRLVVGENPAGFELDVVWRARTNPWETERIVLDDGRGGVSDFAHFFQSGSYEGTLVLDGERRDVTGWLGQRDRSRGVRLVSERGGLHTWIQAQFPDCSVAVLFNLDRENAVTHCDGAVLGVDGVDDPLVSGRHAVEIDDGLDCPRAAFEFTTASGRTLRLDVDATPGGGFLSGGGYGGWHGRRRGADVVEHETWTLDGTVTPRTLDTPMTDRPARFVLDGATEGVGVFEFAVTRSPRYVYRPSL
ncbi:hypothetical protein [Conexibacter arvalis]|uniref:Uncharacterized protein n=1 Tax=Conexibacter arvalis TaxID=912552 RepID=A0A840IHV3_9ACTN|nr:hypothetical protein [Conexibacter arvalis]MBB4663885.1 hypothetical protein [Conexibacter arvalis]